MSGLITQVTAGIRVSVHTRYESRLSSQFASSHVFSYTITIENQTEFPVRLMRRHWFIFDSVGVYNEVEGAGVVGETPVIQPGQTYQYTSACDLKSTIGQMRGYYSMTRIYGNELIRVDIPSFQLAVPYTLN